MKLVKVQIAPLSAFATKLAGDTLFGQFCSFLAKRDSDFLARALDGYNNGKPFVVFSDAFPSSYIPRAIVPSFFYKKPSDKDRKQQKKLNWVDIQHTDKDISQWLINAKDKKMLDTATVSHNHINRLISSTDDSGFAPYTSEQYYYSSAEQANKLDIYLVYDEGVISIDLIRQVLRDIGLYGYGKDATIGMGKFAIEQIDDDFRFDVSTDANAYLTLAPSVVDVGFDADNSYYQTHVKFTKAGADVAITTGNPYKAPIVMAKTAGVFTPKEFSSQRLFIGRGLGGDGSISKAFAKTVHQGYAPVIPVCFSAKEFDNE